MSDKKEYTPEENTAINDATTELYMAIVDKCTELDKAYKDITVADAATNIMTNLHAGLIRTLAKAMNIPSLQVFTLHINSIEKKLAMLEKE